MKPASCRWRGCEGHARACPWVCVDERRWTASTRTSPNSVLNWWRLTTRGATCRYTMARPSTKSARPSRRKCGQVQTAVRVVFAAIQSAAKGVPCLSAGVQACRQACTPRTRARLIRRACTTSNMTGHKGGFYVCDSILDLLKLGPLPSRSAMIEAPWAVSDGPRHYHIAAGWPACANSRSRAALHARIARPVLALEACELSRCAHMPAHTCYGREQTCARVICDRV